MNFQASRNPIRALILCTALATALCGCGGGGDGGGISPPSDGGQPPPLSASSSDAAFVTFVAGPAMALDTASAPFDLTAFVQPPPAADDAAAIATPNDQGPG
jgi:hypothetical protein